MGSALCTSKLGSRLGRAKDCLGALDGVLDLSFQVTLYTVYHAASCIINEMDPKGYVIRRRRHMAPHSPTLLFQSLPIHLRHSSPPPPSLLTSNRVMSEGPVMFHTTPVAFSMLVSSRGDEMALRAAWRARSLPEAMPCPMREEPASAMMARTSAKSTFTRPGTCVGG